jgi:hypothetical protein
MNRKPMESPAEVALRVCLARQLLKDGSNNVQVVNGSTTQNYLCSDLINSDGTAKK